MWIAGFGFAALAAAFAAIDIVTAIPAGQVDRLYAAALLLLLTSSCAKLLLEYVRKERRCRRLKECANLLLEYVRKEQRCRRLKERRDCFDIAMAEGKAPIWRFQAIRLLQCYSGTDFSRAKHGMKEGKAKTPAVWVAATAAPHHATGNRNLLSGFIMEHDDQFVHAVDGVPRRVLARGAVITDSMVLPDVWFVPGLTENLVSVSQLVELDHTVGFSCGECCIRGPDGNVVGNGNLKEGGHYVLDFLKVPLAI